MNENSQLNENVFRGIFFVCKTNCIVFGCFFVCFFFLATLLCCRGPGYKLSGHIYFVSAWEYGNVSVFMLLPVLDHIYALKGELLA